jgi:hypothetical protein
MASSGTKQSLVKASMYLCLSNLDGHLRGHQMSTATSIVGYRLMHKSIANICPFIIRYPIFVCLLICPVILFI